MIIVSNLWSHYYNYAKDACFRKLYWMNLIEYTGLKLRLEFDCILYGDTL